MFFLVLFQGPLQFAGCEDLSSLSRAFWGPFRCSSSRGVMLPASTLEISPSGPCEHPLLPVPHSSLAGGAPWPEVCQALLLGRVGLPCFLPASRTHCSYGQRKMDFWFQGVIHLSTSIRLSDALFLFLPFSFPLWAVEGKWQL